MQNLAVPCVAGFSNVELFHVIQNTRQVCEPYITLIMSKCEIVHELNDYRSCIHNSKLVG